MKTYYNDDMGTEFECIILVCSIQADKYLILDIETGEKGWCSCHLIIE